MEIVTNLNNDGPGSLRQAIADAALGEEITFSVTGIINLNAEIDVMQDVIITGPGLGSMFLSGQGISRVLHINAGTVQITGLSIVSGGQADGGGIYNEGTLTLDNVVISSCSVTNSGGGIYNTSTVIASNVNITSCHSDVSGGGIYNTGTFRFQNGNLTGNTSDNDGAGIYNDGTAGNVTYPWLNISLSGNSASGAGGAAYSTSTVWYEECTFDGNEGAAGLAVFNVFGTATFIRCAVINHAGTAITNSSGTVDVRNSTISTNTTGHEVIAGGSNFYNSTVTLNGTGLICDASGVVVFYNTILSGSTIDYSGPTDSAASLGHNIFGVNINPITPGSGDQSVLTFAELFLGPLQDNGGPTYTHELLFGSPAIDAGDNTDAPDTDQRGTGYPRVRNSTIDIGAFESEVDDPPNPPDPIPTPDPPFPEPTPDPVAPAGTWTCANPPSRCPRPEDPVINSSSEDLDPVTYESATVFGFTDWDPGIGQPFARAEGCGIKCYAPTQAEADACAEALALSCQEEENPIPDPGQTFPAGGAGTPMPPIPPNTSVTVRPRFGNEAYTLQQRCPDGTIVTYTVFANMTFGLTQEIANQKAQALAEQKIVLTKWCVVPITALHCIDQPITGSFRVVGYNPQMPIQMYPITKVSGEYPPGIRFDQFTPGVWTATGTPTTEGLYTFTVRITNGDNTTKTSTMSMLIWSITTEPSDPVVGVPYSVQMVASGDHITTQFAVASGTLPPGLTLTTEGLLSGTPTETGAYFFIIEAIATNTLGPGSCSKEFTLEVSAGDSCEIVDNLEWEFTNEATGGTVVTNTASGGTVNQRVEGGIDVVLNVSAVASGLHVNYGPQKIINLHVVWTTNGASEMDTALNISVNSPLFIGWNGWTSPELPGPGTYDIQFVVPDQTNPLNDLQVTVNSISAGPAFFNEVAVTMTCFCPWDEFEYTYMNNPSLGVVEINTGSGGSVRQRVTGNGASCQADSQAYNWSDKGEFTGNVHLIWDGSGVGFGNAFFTINLTSDAGNILLAESWDATFPTPGEYNIPITVPAQGPASTLLLVLVSQSNGPGEHMDVQVELTCD